MCFLAHRTLFRLGSNAVSHREEILASVSTFYQCFSLAVSVVGRWLILGVDTYEKGHVKE